MTKKTSLIGLYPDLNRLRFGSILHALLSDHSPRHEQHLAILESVVHEAAEREWLDQESWGRLRAGDDAVVLSILDELQIAQALDRAGYSLHFNPPGDGNRVGELLIERDEQRFFVEVKSLLPAESIVLAQTTLARLHALTELIPIPARLIIEIDHHPNSGISHKEVRRYLQVAASQMLSGGPAPAAYTHTSGLYLRAIACRPDPTAGHLQLVLNQEEWPEQLATVRRLWRERLWRALRGGYSQLPHNGPTPLILVVDHTQPAPTAQHWLPPLLDMLRMGSHRHLSAVGRILLDDLRTTTLLEPTLFLNPYAVMPLAERPLFSAAELRVCILPQEREPDGV
ncbi:MAG: hypothetical protein H0T53_17160 [Herpetosiphonaceae bacterium]|nr:hypothetical protein [Herpetosiphonaceae bacterium]